MKTVQRQHREPDILLKQKENQLPMKIKMMSKTEKTQQTTKPKIVQKPLPINKIPQFQNFILRFYQNHGRHELPWRQTSDPYRILVSELMLQQTQVNRVIPKYIKFLHHFPNIQTLANAELREVLIFWQGLGYNRRAKYLWNLSKKMTELTVQPAPNTFPKTTQDLQKLPGIGPYTASAILTFAFNIPSVVIETNIRAVFLYHFFPGQERVPDSTLNPIISQTLFMQNPREWYWALMDYGAYLKTVLPNPSRRSRHHNKQSMFQGSLRQVRGEIIRLLTHSESITINDLQKKIVGNKMHFPIALQQLVDEKLVVKNDTILSLP